LSRTDSIGVITKTNVKYLKVATHRICPLEGTEETVSTEVYFLIHSEDRNTNSCVSKIDRNVKDTSTTNKL